MLPLGGIFNDLSGDFPELRAARRARREYLACLALAILLPAVLFIIFALTNTPTPPPVVGP
ncbi:hypothetical protein [Sulfitobacter sp. JB4-11]|uniref:hypothetical protein n=1 Tax=Sulfitobacter rhodophyticola TaxID=3238304 RepID=UPI0035184E1A